MHMKTCKHTDNKLISLKYSNPCFIGHSTSSLQMKVFYRTQNYFILIDFNIEKQHLQDSMPVPHRELLIEHDRVGGESNVRLIKGS